MARGLLLLTASLALAGCEAERNDLIVDLRTDFLPVLEFSEVMLHVESPEETLPMPISIRPNTADDYLTGVRLADLEGVPGGTTRLRVDLFDREGDQLISRVVLASARGTTLVTVVITRDCRDVECPTPGGDPALQACFAGRCVDPRCTGERTERCGGSDCTRDADCPTGPECTTPRCVSGACLVEANHDACEMPGYCDPEEGCLSCSAAPTKPATGATIPASLLAIAITVLLFRRSLATSRARRSRSSRSECRRPRIERGW